MAYRTVAETKEYAAQMLHEDETEALLAGSTTEGTQDIIERWLTRSFDRIASWYHWKWLEDTRAFTWPAIASGAETSILYLPDYVYRVLSMYSSSLSYREPVILMNKLQFDNQRAGVNAGRGQDVLIEFGYYGVAADPTAGTVTATSDAAASADVGMQIRIEGLTGTGVTARTAIETITLATAANTATSSTTFSGGQGGVRRISIVPDTVPSAGGGVVTVTCGGTTIETLDSSREREHEHIRTELYATVDAPGEYTVSYYRRPFNVTADTDIIPLPHEFHDLIETGIMRELQKFRGEWANVAIIDREWKERMKEFVGWNNRQPGAKRVFSAAKQWGPRRRYQ